MQNISFNILLLIIIIYTFFTNVENLENTGPTDAIKEAVKQVYLADVEAIRNLSAVATKLQANDGFTAPAHMNIRGKVNINSPADAKSLPANVCLSVDNQAETTIRLKTKGDDIKNITLTNNDGNFKLGNAKSDDLLNIKSDGNVAIKNTLTTGSLTTGSLTTGSLTSQNIRAEANLSVVNGLNTKTLDVSETIKAGSITSNIFNTRNKARYIVIGNHNRPDLAVDSWSLIEAEVYDINGTNIAKGKNVTIEKGEAGNSSNHPLSKITDGIIFENRSFVDNMITGYHGSSGLSQAVKIDLGAEYDISQIVLFNRYKQDLANRLNGTTIELLNSSGTRMRLIQTGIWNNVYTKEYVL